MAAHNHALGPNGTEMGKRDLSLEGQAQAILATNPYLTQQQLKLEARRGRVVLRGIVKSFFQKQMAQEALKKVEGIEQIENELEVIWS